MVAAANPVGGHYTRSKTVNENLKMSAAIQSRFDLIFLLLDRPNEVRTVIITISRIEVMNITLTALFL